MIGSVGHTAPNTLPSSGNKYRLIASIAFQVGTVWIKAVLTHAECEQGTWKP